MDDAGGGRGMNPIPPTRARDADGKKSCGIALFGLKGGRGGGRVETMKMGWRMQAWGAGWAVLALLALGCRSGTGTMAGGGKYVATTNWAYFGVGGEGKSADVFLVAPTVDIQDEENMSLSDDRTKAAFRGALEMERGIFEGDGRLFAPFYGQAAMKAYSMGEEDRERCLARAYEDVSEAFRQYWTTENGGRPIVLAGFSQGADMCLRLLAEHFGEEGVRGRLVAAYVMGWPCPPSLSKEHPQVVPARGERDTGVVVCFECEAPEVEGTFLYPAGGEVSACINPLLWRTDGEVAGRELNRGACFTDREGRIVREEAEFCGAYVDTGRGVVRVTGGEAEEDAPLVPGLPEGAFHVYDYQFFYRNLQENVEKRIRAWQAGRGATGE